MLRLFNSTRTVLSEWTERLRAQALSDGGCLNKVTAFRPEMAVHGRYGLPCAGCQTGGKLLADRAMSHLLKGDRPKTLDDLP